MSFLFGKKNKQPSSALPPAVRGISSSNGQDAPPVSLNGALRDADKSRPGPQAQPPSTHHQSPSQSQSQTPTPGGSVNTSLSSLQAPASQAPPDSKPSRERSDASAQPHNAPQTARITGAPQDSPYPWSSRRLNFTGGNPFPRYGAAINATASKDGTIYLMGGLVGGATVKGDLWLTDVGNGSMACYPISTTGDGPGPRVGHASLLVGNAFIVFGGDTKLADNDDLDDTLYLLNTSTKHWSRALPQGPRPTGRYGHTLNILGSKIYIFGGQVEGFFFNDLVAFDLNSLQSSASRWEVLLPNTKGLVSSQCNSPPARTNHSVVTWNDKLYLFGGTDGVTWFNDVWTYEPRSNTWTELDCIGYIPVAREGHSAALVNDTMYIFGGRTQEGVDLGDLAAFRISSRRWYMFQNMGHSPSARSGHSMTAFGKHIVVLAGEPSSFVSEKNELSLAYILDTSKIRYPPNESVPPQQALNAPQKTMTGERNNNIQGKPGSAPGRESLMSGSQQPRAPDVAPNGMSSTAGSRLPRAAGQAPSGPPQFQQPPQPRLNDSNPQVVANPRTKTPTKGERTHGPSVDTGAMSSLNRDNMSPTTRDNSSSSSAAAANITTEMQRKTPDAVSPVVPKQSIETIRSGSAASRNTSRSHRQQLSQESVEQTASRRSTEAQHQHAASRDLEPQTTVRSVVTSPAINQRNNELAQELEMVKGRNAWYASELALARKAGYNPGPSSSPVFDERSAESFRDEDRPLLEALLKMKTELERVQASIKSQGEEAAKKIADVERQRDAAVSEAIYAKTKLAAHGGGSQNGTPMLDGARSAGTPDMDRLNDVNRRLAASLAAQNDLSEKVERLTQEIQSERKAKLLAEETTEAAQNRVQELNSTRQKASAEFESLRAELHEAERVAREVSASAAEAEAASKLLAIDKQELSAKVARMSEESKSHTITLKSLRDAVAASAERSMILEKQLEEDRAQGDSLRQKLAQLRAEHEARTAELETATQKLHDAEELAERYAEEARHHREAVLSGLGNLANDPAKEEDAMEERVTILRQQAEAATSLARKNQSAADQASEKLRRAEERIAGLEAYQEQSSREGLTIRKQLQQAMRDMQTCEAEKVELRQQYERLRLESNAFEVQLRTLKNLLEERGVNPTDARRSRVLESPNSRFGTPDLNRVRELEQQIELVNKAHEELRGAFEQREHEVSKEWEEKLQALHNDHQAAVKYLRGTEKMLAKMKQELDRYKNANIKLEEELSRTRETVRSSAEEQAAKWDAERTSLETELSNVQEAMTESVSRLQSQVSALQAELTSARDAAEVATKNAKQATSAADQSRTDLESLRRQYALVEERAREAENRVQMFLDQFETSVDNYRRQSQVPMESMNGDHHARRHTHDSIASAESLYSHNDGSSTPDANQRPASAATRNSMALDNLASELDALRSHWETTNKAYRLSDRFDFERTPTKDRNESTESLSQWTPRMDMGHADEAKAERQNTHAAQPWSPTTSSTVLPSAPS